MIQIIQWRMSECERLGVTFRFNSFADAATVLADAPDVVIIATGGLPHTEVLAEGNDLVVSAWDILSGDAQPGRNVLIYDDAGDYAGLQAAEKIAETGARVEVMTPVTAASPGGDGDVADALHARPAKARRDLHRDLEAGRRARDGNGLTVASIGSDYGGVTRERQVDQVVVNHGTRPLDDVYFDLRPGSVNLGEVDYEALVEGRPQTVPAIRDGRYQLFRIGDAVAARNTHAAIYDALRLVAREGSRIWAGSRPECPWPAGRARQRPAVARSPDRPARRRYSFRHC
jgi:pyruvate/2-oxoglutarate dehydrogenase complex dihydrolipoamide dehydrogenase (E3) component